MPRTKKPKFEKLYVGDGFGNFLVLKMNGRVVASTPSRKPESERYAHLFATSPELVEAAEQYLALYPVVDGVFMSKMDSKTGEQIQERLANLAAALKKATQG